MSIFSKLRRTIIKEGSTYKASDLFLINESERFPLPFSERDFLYQEEIPKEYLLLGSNEDWDMHKRCFKFLNRNKFEPIEGKEIPSVFVGGPPYDANNLNPDEPNDFIWHSKDHSRDSSYCKIFLTYKKLDPIRQEKFLNDISRIFWFVRPNEYENQTKFHTLMSRVAYYDTPEEIFSTVKAISDLIKKSLETNDDSDDNINIGKVIDRLRKIEKGEKITQERIDKLIRDLKYSVYAAYEKSFIGEFFKEYKGDYRLKWLKASGGNTFYSSDAETKVEIKGFKDLILNIKREKDLGIDIDYDKYADMMIKSIDDLHTPQSITKADIKLRSNKSISIYGSKSKILGDTEPNLFEVKKRPYNQPSYLSEYFSVYKSSAFSKKYGKDPIVRNIYNNIIERLYREFYHGDLGNDIINSMKHKMVGIFFDEESVGVEGIKMPIFVPINNILLEWSDIGWANKKRLSIRYSIINESDYFFYNRANNELIPQDLIEEYIGLSPEEIDENIINYKNLLLEGRKKDILKKYGKNKKTKKVINYFSENDPSGNNKYLEWMVKVYLGIGKQEAGHTYENISYIVELFHKNLQRIKNKDINSYTFERLAEIVLEAEEKRKAKEAEKEVKKEKTVIYEDDNWLVVSPHSWKASCYYGAGTKWCVTSKDTSSHWERYSRNASFFYVINKKLKKKNPLYKVAYRIIGRKGKYELWDAEDLEMSRQDRGKKWLRKLPPEIIEKAELYHEEKYPASDERPDWVDDDDRAQALTNFKDSYDIEPADDWYYGMPIYEIDGEFWVVGDSDEMREAIYEKYDEYGDDELVEYYDHEGYYFEMNDEDSFIENEADNYIGDLSDEEILAITGYDGKKEDIETSIEELRDQIGDSEDEDEIDELEADLSDYESELDSVLDDAKEELYERYSDQWRECLSDGPVECLINEKGWFSNAWELWKSDMVSLKRYDLLEDITSDADYDEIAWYDSWDEDSDDEGYNWVLFQIDY